MMKREHLKNLKGGEWVKWSRYFRSLTTVHISEYPEKTVNCQMKMQIYLVKNKLKIVMS